MLESATQTLVFVAGLPFEARLAAGIYGRVICGSKGHNLAESVIHAITSECRGLISLGVAGDFCPTWLPGLASSVQKYCGVKLGWGQMQAGRRAYCRPYPIQSMEKF
jgi:hypothetical protein